MALAALKHRLKPDFVLELSTDEANYVLDCLFKCEPSDDSPLDFDTVWDELRDTLDQAGVLDLDHDHADVCG